MSLPEPVLNSGRFIVQQGDKHALPQMRFCISRTMVEPSIVDGKPVEVYDDGYDYGPLHSLRYHPTRRHAEAALSHFEAHHAKLTAALALEQKPSTQQGDKLATDALQLSAYMCTARHAGCSWGEVEETVRQKFDPSAIAAIRETHPGAASLEAIFLGMSDTRSAPADLVATGHAVEHMSASGGVAGASTFGHLDDEDNLDSGVERKSKFAAVPEWTYAGKAPGKHTFFESIALAELEGKSIRLDAETQRALLGFPVFGQRSITVLPDGKVKSTVSVCFGTDYETATWDAATIQAAVESKLQLHPNVSGKKYFAVSSFEQQRLADAGYTPEI